MWLSISNNLGLDYLDQHFHGKQFKKLVLNSIISKAFKELASH